VKYLKILYILRTQNFIRFTSGIFKSLSTRKSNFRSNVQKFESDIQHLDFPFKWSLKRFENWMLVFNNRLISSERLDILEIGCLHGHSANFFAWYFPSSTITCVDAWGLFSKKGTPDQQDKDELLFDTNTKHVGTRLVKVKAFSISYFESKYGQRNLYDLIYIDGSHDFDDVLSDAIYAFRILKPGGVIIFDDLFHRVEKGFDKSVLRALDLFITSKKHELELLRVDSQLFVQKKSDLNVREQKRVTKN
jgi:SAM-dependent methyltransferase